MFLNFATRAPRIALGTAKIHGSECIEYIDQGLAAGYRMIDTAQVYGNEEEVGKSIRSSSIPRGQVFVTTKIAAGFKKNPSSFKEATNSARESLSRLRLEYIDAILIHHPGDDAADPSAAASRRTTWEALEELVLEGSVKNIGLHPWFQQRELVDFCKKEKIYLQAYSAIARNIHSDDSELRKMANKYKMSTAQLLLSYSSQKGYAPIVKAANPGHLVANLEAESIMISEKDMAVLDSWDEGIKGSLFPWLTNLGET
ncbi:hypothetical protein N0V90_007074 [Kalmusia sp. IMI 367209]|nr:hypothetical protein N0V90_007074 [Kalmusia sp. IMI 367209]